MNYKLILLMIFVQSIAEISKKQSKIAKLMILLEHGDDDSSLDYDQEISDKNDNENNENESVLENLTSNENNVDSSFNLKNEYYKNIDRLQNSSVKSMPYFKEISRVSLTSDDKIHKILSIQKDKNSDAIYVFDTFTKRKDKFGFPSTHEKSEDTVYLERDIFIKLVEFLFSTNISSSNDIEDTTYRFIKHNDLKNGLFLTLQMDVHYEEITPLNQTVSDVVTRRFTMNNKEYMNFISQVSHFIKETTPSRLMRPTIN